MISARRTKVVSGILFALLAGTTGVAYAVTGSTANPRSVTFYYGETGGQGDSQNFAGYGQVKLCTDAGNSGGSNTYQALYLRNRTLQPDDRIRNYQYVAFNDSTLASSAFDTESSSQFHTTAVWPGVASAPNGDSGYVASRTASLACIVP